MVNAREKENPRLSERIARLEETIQSNAACPVDMKTDLRRAARVLRECCGEEKYMPSPLEVHIVTLLDYIEGFMRGSSPTDLYADNIPELIKLRVNLETSADKWSRILAGKVQSEVKIYIDPISRELSKELNDALSSLQVLKLNPGDEIDSLGRLREVISSIRKTKGVGESVMLLEIFSGVIEDCVRPELPPKDR